MSDQNKKQTPERAEQPAASALSASPGSQIVHMREVLPVPFLRLSEIGEELKRKHGGREVLIKQEGHELVFFSENNAESIAESIHPE